MTPEASTLFQRISVAISNRAEVKTRKIQEEGKRAFETGDTDAVRTSANNLDDLRSFAPALHEKIKQVNELLQQYGLDRTDISFEELGLLTGNETPIGVVEAIKPAYERKRGMKKKSDIYVPDSKYVGLLGIVEKNNQKGYKNSTLKDIADNMLLPDKRNVKNNNSAREWITVARGMESKAILKESAKKGAANMEDLYMPHFIGSEGAVAKYYGYVIENYGDMSPRDFIDSVLKRQLERTKRVATTLKRVAEAAKTVDKDRARPSDEVKKVLEHPIMPAVEVQLSGKLRNTELLDRVKNEVLDGQDPFMVAGGNGWNHRDQDKARETLERSCSEASDKKNQHNIKYTDQQVLNYLCNEVLPIIRSTHKNRAVAAKMINEANYEAVKFLNSLLRSVGVDHRIKAADDILHILYQKKEINLISMDCY